MMLYQAQSEATIKLKEIALRHGYLTGKWFLHFHHLFFLPLHLTLGYVPRLAFTTPDKVDAIWNRLAREYSGARAT